MGFNVQIMPLPEVYLAIQQGAVSGQENPIDTIYANKFYEVAPNVTLTQHVYSPIPLTISEKTWQKLSPADREAVHQGGEGSGGLEPQGNQRQRRPPAEGDGERRAPRSRGPTSGRSATRCSRSTPRPRRSTAPMSTPSWPTPKRCARPCRRSKRAASAGSAGAAPARRDPARPQARSMRAAARRTRRAPRRMPLARRGRRLDRRRASARRWSCSSSSMWCCTCSARTSPGPPSSCELLMVWVTFLGGACGGAARRAHDDHRVPRQARPARPRARPTRAVQLLVPGGAGAARLVRHGHRRSPAGATS